MVSVFLGGKLQKSGDNGRLAMEFWYFCHFCPCPWHRTKVVGCWLAVGFGALREDAVYAHNGCAALNWNAR
jgi:hypothetical protein